MDKQYSDFLAHDTLVLYTCENMKWSQNNDEIDMNPLDDYFTLRQGSTVKVIDHLGNNIFMIESMDGKRVGYANKSSLENFDAVFEEANQQFLQDLATTAIETEPEKSEGLKAASSNFAADEPQFDQEFEGLPAILENPEDELPSIEAPRADKDDMDDLNESLKAFKFSDGFTAQLPTQSTPAPKKPEFGSQPASAQPGLKTIFEKKRHLPDSTLVSEEEIRLEETKESVAKFGDANNSTAFASFEAMFRDLQTAMVTMNNQISQIGAQQSEIRVQTEERFRNQEISNRELKNLYKNLRRESFYPQSTTTLRSNTTAAQKNVPRESTDAFGVPMFNGIPPLDRTGVPPSSHSLVNRHQSKSPPNFEKTLAYLRKNQDKIPQWEDYRLKMPLVLFFGKVIYKFARTHQILNPDLLDQWVPYAFPEVNQERIYLYLHDIQGKFKGEGLYVIFKELAKVLKPDEIVTIDSLRPRQDLETLQDMIIRLNCEIPMCQNMTEKEVPNHIYNFILRTEADTAFGVEFKRETLKYDKSLLSVDSLLDTARRIDRIVSPVTNVPSKQVYTSSNNVASYADIAKRQKILRPTHNSGNSAQSSFARCKTCQCKHSRRRPDGNFWPYCQDCYIKNARKSYHRAPVYNSPPRSRRGGTCRYCKKQHTDRSESGRFYPVCKTCFRQNKRSGPRNNGFAPRGRATEISINELEGDHLRKTAEVLKVSHVYETASNSWSKQYRMHVAVGNSQNGTKIKGLIDTGANCEVLSLAACRRLGIAHLINRNHKPSTYGVDGHNIGDIGTVRAKIFVGDIPYTASFTVLNHIHGFDIMIGTRFLLQSQLMDRIYNVVKDSVGPENLSRGN